MAITESPAHYRHELAAIGQDQSGVEALMADNTVSGLERLLAKEHLKLAERAMGSSLGLGVVGYGLLQAVNSAQTSQPEAALSYVLASLPATLSLGFLVNGARHLKHAGHHYMLYKIFAALDKDDKPSADDPVQILDAPASATEKKKQPTAYLD